MNVGSSQCNVNIAVVMCHNYRSNNTFTAQNRLDSIELAAQRYKIRKYGIKKHIPRHQYSGQCLVPTAGASRL